MEKINKEIMLRGVYLVANVVVVFGFLLPYLISAKSSELVIIGFVLMVANIVHLIMFGFKLSKLITSSSKNKTEEAKSEK